MLLLLIFIQFYTGLPLSWHQFLYIQLPGLCPSEYASPHRVETNAIYTYYVLMLGLSGLQTVYPDLVLIVSHPVPFSLISAVEGSLVTVVWEKWPGLFSYLWITMPLVLMRKVLLFF